jgi:hypothetical protein
MGEALRRGEQLGVEGVDYDLKWDNQGNLIVVPRTKETPPPVAVTHEDVARRAYEISEQRQRAGQSGDMLSDWAQAQQELSRATELPPPTSGESEPWVSAIANKYTQARTAAGELGEVAPGEGYSKEELRQRGLRMRPEEINQHVSDLMNRTGDPKLQAAAVAAEEARLSQRAHAASRAADANPGNHELALASENAFKDVTDFHNGPVATLKNNWHAQGMTMQGEVPVDLATFNGQREAFLRDVGKAPPPKLEPMLRKNAKKVSDAVAKDNGVMRKLGAEIDRQTARRRLPTADQVRLAIMERIKDMPCRR